MDDSILKNNKNPNNLTSNKDEAVCHDCNEKLVYKTLKPLQQQQQQHHDEFKFKTTDFAYCLKCNKGTNSKKLFVLIEANNDEECNLAINAIHNINPDANVNVFESSSSSSATSSSSESPNPKSTKNFRLLNSTSRSSFGSISDNGSPGTCGGNSSNESGSMERQESRDSGFCSLSNSSFESMKSLSINDNNYNLTYGSQLTIPNDLVDLRSPIRRKWKKEHAWRYTNSSAKNFSIDDGDQLSSKPASLNIIEPIEETYETNSNGGSSTTERSISKDNSLEISLDNLNTNDTDSTVTVITKPKNLSEINNKVTMATSATNQKKRGKLIRESTIDDDNTNQSPPLSSLNDNNSENVKNNNECEKNVKKINIFSNRSSPPEKRASFNVQKQMSIDDTYSIDCENGADEQHGNNTQIEANDYMNDYEKNVIRSRVKAINNSYKLTSKYNKHDLHRNIGKFSFDTQHQQNEQLRSKIPIVRVQSFLDFNEGDDLAASEQKQNDNKQESALEQKQATYCGSSPSTSPQSFKDGCKKSNINIVDHTNKSLDDARRTIDQSSLSSLFPQSPLLANNNSSPIHSIKYGQNHSFDCDYKPSPHVFDPKISSSSASLLNQGNSMQTPTILFTQSASLDRYNYNPPEFNLVKTPYTLGRKLNSNSNDNTNNHNNNNNNKVFSTFEQHQHNYNLGTSKIEQKDTLGVRSTQQSTSQNVQSTVMPSPSLSASYTHLYNQIEYQQQQQQLRQHHHHHFNPQNSLYHLQQNVLSTSSPSINTFGKKDAQINSNKQECSPSVSPKHNSKNSNNNNQPQISPSQSSSNLLKQNEILNAFFNPYLQNINPTATKTLQTHGYPFQSYLQNSEIILNTKQFAIPQLSNFSIKNENEQYQQQQNYMKFKAEMFDKKYFTNKIDNVKDGMDLDSHHSGLNIFSPSSSKVKRQTNEIHKPHACTFCQKKFARSDMLIRHSRLHSGVRPYKCQQCGQEFSRSDHLNTHQRTHTGEKPYRCPHPKCTYAACRKDMITRHLKVHNKNRSSSSSNLLINSMAANLTVDVTSSRHASTSSPSSLSLSVSSPPQFSISLTSPLMNLDIGSDQESSSILSNDNSRSSKTVAQGTNVNDSSSNENENVILKSYNTDKESGS